MKYIVDHDFHIHSGLSSCSGDAEQSPERILRYAEENGFTKICVTNHCWDSAVPGASWWYAPQDVAHISQDLPLPQGKNTAFHFGCETEMDKHGTIAMTQFDKFDFVIVPTTHMHMEGFTREAEDLTVPRMTELYINRIHTLLSYDLPFTKMGLAHMTCSKVASDNWQMHLDVLQNVSDEQFAEIYRKIKQKGMGVELNIDIFKYKDNEVDIQMRPYKIAKELGCKFYLGSDAHHPAQLDAARARFEEIVRLLDLEESDKFDPFK